MLSSWLRRHNKSNRNSKLVGITGVILVVVLILFIGLSSSKKTTCTLKSDQSKNGYVLETKYVIKSKKDIVEQVNITQTITSDKKEVLTKFENQFKEQYSYNKKVYGGYSYKISSNSKKVISKVDIDYKKFDMQKFIKNNVAMKQYTKNNNLTLEGAKKLYSSSGAVCK